MSVLVLAESPKGTFKKAAFEAVHYGHKAAQSLGGDCIALVIGAADNAGELGSYGASTVIQITEYSGGVDASAYANIIAQVAGQVGAHTIVVNHSSTGKSVAGRVAVRMNAGIASQVNTVPEAAGGGITVTKPVFSGKAFAKLQISGDKRVLSLMGLSLIHI